MGLGKTYTGGEKLVQLGAKVNLVICQKSKIEDWVEHFNSNYGECIVFNLTNKKDFEEFVETVKFYTTKYDGVVIGVINYELVWRRPELTQLKDFTLMLDESSLIQNEQAKRSKFILKKLKPANVILLSGTPTGGKYENLWSQLHLLGWDISKTTYWNTYIDYHFEDMGGFPVRFIDGYKNVDRLKRKMREYGCHFLKTEDVLELPDQIFTTVRVPVSKEYRKFRKDRVVEVDGVQLVGDNTLTKMLYERQLCGQYSKAKLEAFRDLVESTEDRLIVFYNFTAEIVKMTEITSQYGRRFSVVNGMEKNLEAYENEANSVTFIQYQAGAMGLNLQKANKIIYYSPPLSSELYEQSKKRINRIGQSKTCYYYNLTVSGSIEERIYKTLAMRRDFTDKLFEEMEEK
jgi:SNF2 family DNA or RNA helicase